MSSPRPLVPPRYWWGHSLAWFGLGAAATAVGIWLAPPALRIDPAMITERAYFWACLGGFASAPPVFASLALTRAQRPLWLVVSATVGTALLGGLAWAYVFDRIPWPFPPGFLDQLQPPYPPGGQPPDLLFPAFPFTLVLLAWCGLVIPVLHAAELQLEREAGLAARSAAVEARMAALRYQLNPHFLFNALNSVVGAMDDDPRQAKGIVRDLSELLRFVLDESPETTLQKELRAIEVYLAIEKARFEDRLWIEIDVDPGVRGTRLPPMLLQPLVENALKHGQAAGAPVLRLSFRARRRDNALSIEIRNTGVLDPSPRQEGFGIGLRNLRERLTHLYGTRATFTLEGRDGTVIAHLTLPVEPRP